MSFNVFGLIWFVEDAQRKACTRELIDFAKDMSRKYKCPILFDTDMKKYAEIY